MASDWLRVTDWSLLAAIKMPWYKSILHNVSVDPSDLLDALTAAEEKMNDDKIERLLCGAVKYLRQNRAKPEPAMFLTLLFLAKSKANLFNSDLVVEVSFTMLFIWVFIPVYLWSYLPPT